MPLLPLPLAIVNFSSGPSVDPTIQWTLEPSVLVGVALITTLYVLAWRRARMTGSSHAPGYGRLALFCGGMATVLIALVSPLDVLADQLLVMHMVQHILLLDIAPILCILSLNKVLLRPVSRRLHQLERNSGPFGHPAFAVVCYASIVLVWHVPSAYDSALHSTTVHAFEHLCFAFAGTLYWWHVLSPIRARRRLTGLGPLAYMVSTRLLVAAVGIVLIFAPHPIYPYYAHQPHFWGLSPIDDQSLAGGVMALEQSIVMGIALVYLFYKMLSESERDAQRAERYEVV